jgi:hypothetical protein
VQRARRHLRAVLLPAVLALSTALAGCGSDDEAQAVAALKSQIVANNAMQSETAVSDEQASCIAKGAVAEITVDRLQDYRILDGDLEVEKAIDDVSLSAKDADALAGVYLDCSDAEKIVEDRLVERLVPKKASARAEVEACVRDAVTTASVRDILAQSFEKTDAAAYASLAKKLGACSPGAGS